MAVSPCHLELQGLQIWTWDGLRYLIGRKHKHLKQMFQSIDIADERCFQEFSTTLNTKYSSTIEPPSRYRKCSREWIQTLERHSTAQEVWLAQVGSFM